MKLQPSDQLTNVQVKTGLHLILKDGLATETMNTLTAGTFLVAIALGAIGWVQTWVWAARLYCWRGC
jgi:hypothetical protein